MQYKETLMAAKKTYQSQVNNPKFVIGDLVHIPSNVVLWSGTGSGTGIPVRTELPTTGVVIDELSDTVIVFVHGRRMNANKRHVYPYKEEYNEGN